MSAVDETGYIENWTKLERIMKTVWVFPEYKTKFFSAIKKTEIYTDLRGFFRLKETGEKTSKRHYGETKKEAEEKVREKLVSFKGTLSKELKKREKALKKLKEVVEKETSKINQKNKIILALKQILEE